MGANWKRGLVLAFAMTVVSTATAQESDHARPLRETAPFWRELRHPGYARANELSAQGTQFLLRAEIDPAMREAHMRSALLRFERALGHYADLREALFQRAAVLTRLETYDAETGQAVRHDQEALEAFEELQRRHPDYRAEIVYFELALLHGRLGDYPSSIVAYEHSIEHSIQANDALSTTHSNLAETRMQTGDLLGAVRDYERAVEIARNTPDARPITLGLAQFGLAVALDRLGERRSAVEWAGRAIQAAGDSLDHLEADSVFFEPVAEIHWYKALGHQAMAESRTGHERVEALEAALRERRRYSSLSADDDPWKQLGAEREAQVEELLRRAR